MFTWLKNNWYWFFLLALAFGLGLLWEWWNSPLNSHLCFESGKALTVAVVREMSYWWGWALIFAGAALPFLAVFVWIGFELRRMNTARK